MALRLTEPQVQALDARTEGWPAGLHMAALTLATQCDAESFIRSFTGSHRLMQDYLVKEVLQRLPAAVQAFLLRTPILQRMCPELCDAVMQVEGGRESLHSLDLGTLFVVPLDDRRWYRYDHLFGAMLQQRLHESEAVAPLHLRASAWYESQGTAWHAAVLSGGRRACTSVVAGPASGISGRPPAWTPTRPGG